jgi:DNA-binding NarL/FixJ family response regulator
MPPPRIILVDDHVLLLDAVTRVLEPEFQVVGKFSDGETMLDSIADLQPDAVVLDLGMPGMNGFVAARRLLEVTPKLKIIFLTMNQDEHTVAEAFRSGVAGYVVKTAAADELVQALREVLRGGYYASPSLTEDIVGSFVKKFKAMKPAFELTRRQREVLQLLAEGKSMKEIARQLEITAHTVAFHKYAMMKELNITTTAELISFGLKNALIEI